MWFSIEIVGEVLARKALRALLSLGASDKRYIAGVHVFVPLSHRIPKASSLNPVSLRLPSSCCFSNALIKVSCIWSVSLNKNEFLTSGGFFGARAFVKNFCQQERQKACEGKMCKVVFTYAIRLLASIKIGHESRDTPF